MLFISSERMCLKCIYFIQENRLEYLPDALFSLPALTTLDVSNNKLKKLPYSLWRSPRLRDLNASLNLLRDLPTKAEHVIFFCIHMYIRMYIST